MAAVVAVALLEIPNKAKRKAKCSSALRARKSHAATTASTAHAVKLALSALHAPTTAIQSMVIVPTRLLKASALHALMEMSNNEPPSAAAPVSSAIANAATATMTSLHALTPTWEPSKVMHVMATLAAAMVASLTQCAPAWTAWQIVAVAVALAAIAGALAEAIVEVAIEVALEAATVVNPPSTTEE